MDFKLFLCFYQIILTTIHISLMFTKNYPNSYLYKLLITLILIIPILINFIP